MANNTELSLAEQFVRDEGWALDTISGKSVKKAFEAGQKVNEDLTKDNITLKWSDEDVLLAINRARYGTVTAEGTRRWQWTKQVILNSLEK